LTGERHDDDVKEETGAPGELGIYPMEKLGFQTPKTVYFMVMCRQSSLGFKPKPDRKHTMFFWAVAMMELRNDTSLKYNHFIIPRSSYLTHLHHAPN